MISKTKLNSLEQEILMQEQITVANEINRLELEIANNNVNSVQNNRLRFWTFFFSGFIMAAIAIYILIIIAIGDLINLSFALQKFLVICSSILIILMPLINVGIWVAISLHIKYKNEQYLRANRVMLTRLEKYYKVLKYEFDPEKYRLYDDDFVVDIDENGNLIKYIRFFNDDGSITTKPFTDMKQLRAFIDDAEERKQQEIANKHLLDSMNKFEIANKQFNSFDELDNNLNSKSIIDDSNINATKFIKDTDYLPEQYNSKVSKWFNNKEFKEVNNFREVLASQTYNSDLDNNDFTYTDAAWLKEQFNTKEKGSNVFFRQYDLSAKSLGKARDVQEFINVNKNFNLNKNPEINWEDTIDPKDYQHNKLNAYNDAIKRYEDYALDLTKQQLATEYELRHNNKKVLRVQLTNDLGVNVYEAVDPFKNVKQELEKQQRRIDEVNKTKALLLENGIENVNFEGLSVKELRKIAKEKIKEHNELLRLSKDKNVDSVIILENNISKIKAETFKEVHLPNERYKNPDGLWEYYDESGQYYVCDEATNQWLPISPASERFEEQKQQRINELIKNYNEEGERRLQAQQDELDKKVDEINNVENNINKKEGWLAKRRRESQELKAQEKENKEFEKQQNKEFEEQYKNKVNNYQKQFDQENADDYYIETHNANEPFVNDHGQWMYHDGNGNYYIADETNNWVPSQKPKVIKKEKKDDDLLSPWEKEQKAVEEQKEHNKKANDTSQEQQQQTDYYASQQQQQQQTGAITPQQWQDENGYWWYLDENGNYYYADENGNWIPYTPQQ